MTLPVKWDDALQWAWEYGGNDGPLCFLMDAEPCSAHCGTCDTYNDTMHWAEAIYGVNNCRTMQCRECPASVRHVAYVAGRER